MTEKPRRERTRKWLNPEVNTTRRGNTDSRNSYRTQQPDPSAAQNLPGMSRNLRTTGRGGWTHRTLWPLLDRQPGEKVRGESLASASLSPFKVLPVLSTEWAGHHLKGELETFGGLASGGRGGLMALAASFCGYAKFALHFCRATLTQVSTTGMLIQPILENVGLPGRRLQLEPP